MEVDTSFVSIHRLAQITGLPLAWLEAEARGNRIPHLKVGRRLMFNPELVEQALLARADSTSSPKREAAVA